MLNSIIKALACFAITVPGFSALPAEPAYPTVPAESAVTASKVKVDVNITAREGLKISRLHLYSPELPLMKLDILNTENPSQTSFSVEPGHLYIFVVEASEAETKMNHYLVKETMIDAETSLSFDFAECKNRLTVKNFLPDGSEALCDLKDMADNIIEEGNMAYGFHVFSLSRKGILPAILVNQFVMSRTDKGSGIVDFKGDCFINDLTPDYEIASSRSFRMRQEKGSYCIVANGISGADVNKSITFGNDAAKFVKLDPEYGSIPDGPFTVHDAEWYSFSLSFIKEEGHYVWGAGEGSTSSTCDKSVFVSCQRPEGSFMEMNLMIGKGLADNGLTQYQRTFYKTSSPILRFIDDKIVAGVAPTDDDGAYRELLCPEGGTVSSLWQTWKFHPRFSWEFDPGRQPEFGNSTPCCLALPLWQPGYISSSFDARYYGRLGEIRESDRYAGWAEATIDGEPAFSGNAIELLNWSASKFSERNPQGVYEINLENDNVLVDGMPGLNRTVVSFDASREDHEAPTLTMLNFRDRDDAITDRFDRSEDGTLEFSAGDFRSVMKETLAWCACNDIPEVKVEYSREDKDWFYELPAEEVPELFFMPGFGHFYRAPLSVVDQTSPSGWFKLRISLADAAGNTHVQTISPAFYVEKLAGIDNVRENEALTREGSDITADGLIQLYDLGGRLVREGAGRIPTDGLYGAYIVRHGNTTTKVIL